MCVAAVPVDQNTYHGAVGLLRQGMGTVPLAHLDGRVRVPLGGGAGDGDDPWDAPGPGDLLLGWVRTACVLWGTLEAAAPPGVVSGARSRQRVRFPSELKMLLLAPEDRSFYLYI